MKSQRTDMAGVGTSNTPPRTVIVDGVEAVVARKRWQVWKAAGYYWAEPASFRRHEVKGLQRVVAEFDGTNREAASVLELFR